MSVPPSSSAPSLRSPGLHRAAVFLRALAFNVFFYGLTTIFGLAGVVLRLFARHRILGFAQYWAGLVLWGARTICGIRLSVIGMQYLPPGAPALLASRHQSAFDTIVWMRLLDCPSYVMKQELRRIPLFGPLLIGAGMIPVDRQAGAMALRGLLQAMRRAAQNGRQMIIFPEGTRVPPGERVPLQPGVAAIALHLDMAVTPVATDSGKCWGRRAFMKYPGTIHIELGPPIAAGTPRAALLPAIEAFWREAEARGFQPVDKSVGDMRTPLPVTVK
jgi:1-acyl-sn-glycerol-3-phosphate acyltransferase